MPIVLTSSCELPSRPHPIPLKERSRQRSGHRSGGCRKVIEATEVVAAEARKSMLRRYHIIDLDDLRRAAAKASAHRNESVTPVTVLATRTRRERAE